MAVQRLRLLRTSAAGTDTVHLETNSEIVLRPDGSTVEAGLNALKTAIAALQEQSTANSAWAIKEVQS